MLGLELAGSLADTEVFPTHLDLSMVRDIELTTNIQFIFMQELLKHARRGGRSDIADAVTESIDKFASTS